MHGIPTGCSEEQPAGRGSAADKTAGDEPYVCSTGRSAEMNLDQLTRTF